MYSVESIKRLLMNEWPDDSPSRIRYAYEQFGDARFHLACLGDAHEYFIRDELAPGFNPPIGARCGVCGTAIKRWVP